ncbi:hypothetical protein K231HA_00678 [Lactococcus lactis]|nr:hypothetical protein [Lactococcus lactis]
MGGVLKFNYFIALIDHLTEAYYKYAVARWIFIGLLTLPIIALFIGNRNLSNSIRIKNIVKLDLVAFILLSTTLTSFILGINSIAKVNINIVLLIVFLLALGMLLWRSLTSSKTFLNIRIFKFFFQFFFVIFWDLSIFKSSCLIYYSNIFREFKRNW